MAFRCTPPTKDPVATLAYRPWELAIKPFQVAPQTWYVAGQTWVGCYLIDTGDGLILIDTAIAESAYMLVDSIYRRSRSKRSSSATRTLITVEPQLS